MEELVIRHGASGDITVLRLEGKLDGTTSAALEQAIDAALAGGRRKLLVAMPGVTTVTSAGWGLLISVTKELKAQGGALAVADLKPQVKYSYDMLRIKSLVAAHGSETEAAEALRGGHDEVAGERTGE